MDETLCYEVWILGYDEDDNVNDFEQLEGTFNEEEKAIWFATHYSFSKPAITPKAKVVVEEVVCNTCMNLILESEL